MAGTKSFTVFTKFAVKNNFTGPVLAMAKSADKLAMKAEQVKATLGKVGKVGGMVAKGVGAIGAASAVAGTAVFALARHSATLADDILNTASAIGISTDALQQYRYVGVQAGLTTEEMDTALTKLTVNLGKNFEEVDHALYQIGLSAEGLKAAGPEKALEYIAQGFKNTKDPAKKAAVATAIFGKASVRMVNALDGGSESIAAFRKEAGDIGYVLASGPGSALEAAGKLDDTLDKLGATATGVGNRLASKIIPQVTALAEKFQKGIQPGGQYEGLLRVGEKVLGFFGNLAGGFFDKFGEFATKIAPYVESIVGAIEPLIKPLLSLLDPIFKIVERLAPMVEVVVKIVASVLGPVIDSLKWVLESVATIGTGGEVARGYSAGTPGGNTARTAPRFGTSATPMSPATAPLATSSTTTNTSRVELSVAPGINAKQDKAAPGVTLNNGQTQSFAPVRTRNGTR